MKRVSILIFTILLFICLSAIANAAPTLSFNIDFYGGDTSYVQGAFDTGSTILLNPGETVNVDLYYAVTEQGVIGGGFDIEFDPALLESAGSLTIAAPWMTVPPSPDAVNLRSDFLAFSAVDASADTLLASFALSCIGVGSTEIWAADYNDQPNWLTIGQIVLDDQLPIYLATVNNVPIPGAVWLLGSGLLGLLGIRRRI
jgi:hypothetical protein